MRPIRILLIDDEPIIAQGLTKNFPWEKVPAELVGSAGDGAEGWRLVLEEQPDLVISDIVMPGLTGLDLAERIEHHGLPTRIILISAHDQFSYAQEAVQRGVSAYLLKPIDHELLLAKLQKIHSEHSSAKDHELEFRRLERVVEKTLPLWSTSLLFQIARFGITSLGALDPEIKETLPNALGYLVRCALEPFPDSTSRVLEIRHALLQYFQEVPFQIIENPLTDSLTYLFLTQEALPEQATMETWLDPICRAIRDRFRIAVTIHVMGKFSNYEELHRIYQEDQEGEVVGDRLHARMLSVIEENFKDPDFSLKTCASILNLSPQHLSRLYRQKTDYSFLEHLTRRRMDEAVRLLSTTDLPIGELAEELGFADSRYFSQVFRRHTGQTPSQYRQEQK